MERFVRGLRVDQRGSTIIEYGLIVGLVAVVLCVGLGTFSDKAIDMYAYVQNKVDVF